MRRNIDGNCSGDPCCKPRSIRTINTMNPDDSGNFTIRGTQGIHVTVGTNEIIISGIAVYYDNLDGNLVIDNDAMTIDFAEDIVIAGDLTVNGTYYTVHAEHVYTQDDYIIMRDGALTALGSGQYSGFQVKKYDGTNDGRLVIDNTGTARVGDVGDEQPLLTREESANLTDGALLKWDAGNSKAIDEGTVGSDTKPIKIVNGVATPVTNSLQTELTVETFTLTAEANVRITYLKAFAYGKLVHIDIEFQFDANIAGGTKLAVIPNEYLASGNVPIYLLSINSPVYNHGGGIGWGRNGIFTDTAINSTEIIRGSYTYYRS